MRTIDTEQLAEQLYESWRKRADLMHPVKDDYGIGVRPRRKWKHIDSNEKSIWRSVADTAAQLVG